MKKRNVVMLVVFVIVMFTISLKTHAHASPGDSVIGIIKLFNELFDSSKSNEPNDYVSQQDKQRIMNRYKERGGGNFEFLEPLSPIKIGNQGAVFPYKCKESGSEKIILIATVKNGQNYLLRGSGTVTKEWFQNLMKNDDKIIKDEMIKAFPKHYKQE